MEKLTIEDLQRYPIGKDGLMAYDKYSDRNVIIDGIVYSSTEQILIYPTHILGSRKLDEITLIMYPLFSLIMPILEGGKIPIVELAKIAFKKCDYDAWIDGDNCFVGMSKDRASYKFSYSIYHNSFSVMNVLCLPGNRIEIDRDTFCSNQLQLFKWLYAYHFWMGNQSYFEKGLIIDKGTIK